MFMYSLGMKTKTAKKIASQKSKHVDLGALLDRVNRVADRDGSLRTGSAVIRQAVSQFLDEWDAKHPESPSNA